MTELTAVEHALVVAVDSGDVLDLRGAEVRELRAAVVRDLLLGRVRQDPDPRGVRIAGARLVGSLDLEGITLQRPLRLLDCELPGSLWLRGAHLPLLDLRRSRLASLSVTEATVDRVLLLTETEVTGGVHLDGARIGAACSLRRAVLRNPDGPALVADRVRLSSELLLDDLVADGAGEEGVIRLLGARIDGRLSARRLQVTNPTGPALVADNLQVTDTADFSGGSVLRGHGERGAVRLVAVKAGSLSFGAARLENPAGWALAAHYLDVAGTVYLDTLQATGGLRVSGGRIGGQLNVARSAVDGGDRVVPA